MVALDSDLAFLGIVARVFTGPIDVVCQSAINGVSLRILAAPVWGFRIHFYASDNEASSFFKLIVVTNFDQYLRFRVWGWVFSLNTEPLLEEGSGRERFTEHSNSHSCEVLLVSFSIIAYISKKSSIYNKQLKTAVGEDGVFGEILLLENIT